MRDSLQAVRSQSRKTKRKEVRFMKDYVCPKCGCTEYYVSHDKDGTRRRCKNCQKERMRQIYASSAYKEKHREDDRRRRRGCSPELYQELQEKQHGKCAICGKEANDNLRADHNHQTGKMRGLLCDNCNWGLGNFKDNTVYLQNAIDYLNKHK